MDNVVFCTFERMVSIVRYFLVFSNPTAVKMFENNNNKIISISKFRMEKLENQVTISNSMEIFLIYRFKSHTIHSMVMEKNNNNGYVSHSQLTPENNDANFNFIFFNVNPTKEKKRNKKLFI